MTPEFSLTIQRSGPSGSTTGESGSRFYEWGDEQFWSVTTTISKGVPKYLVPWASKLVAEYAWDHRDEWQELERPAAIALMKAVPNQVRDAAGNLGSRIHAAIEAHVLGRPMPEWPADIAPSMRAVERWLLTADPEYQATEATVYNRQHRYAGTGDAWLTLRRGPLAGKPLVVDYKSGRNVYPDAALQVSAYRRGEFIGAPDGRTELPVPPTEGGAVLHIRPEGCQLREVDTSDKVFMTFLYAKAIHRWAEVDSKTALGDPVPDDLEGSLRASLQVVR